MNTALLGIAAFFAYTFAAVFLALRIQGNRANSADGAMGIQVPAIAGFLAHTALVIGIFTSGLHFAFFNSLALFAWIITGLLMLSTLRWPLGSLGILVYPIAGLCAVLYALTRNSMSVDADSSFTPLLQAHIASSVFAYAMLSLAGLQAIVLAVQDHQLHHHKPGGFVRSLPPLQTMERLMFRVIAVGFVLLTIALGTGFAAVDDWFSHKIIFSAISWLIFAALLAGRQMAGWRGRKAIRLTLSGIGFLILSFFGSKLVLELILGA